jgi:hypothetical protein
MKTCPHCRDSYSNDHVFCMADGNRLLDENGEQETIIGLRMRPPRANKMSDATLVCPSCGLSNRTNSRFCKKCGVPVRADPRENKQQVMSPGRDSPSNHFDGKGSLGPQKQQPIFPPPDPQRRTFWSAMTGQQLYIGGIAALIAIGAIAWALGVSNAPDEPISSSNSAYRSNGGNAGDAKRRAAVTNAYNSSGTSDRSSEVDRSVIGREGHLTQNTNIRSGSNRSAEVRGTHYQGARVKILDVDTYSTPDGVSTWFRVEVLQDGCDSQGQLGCGNNRERDGYFGWMEAEKAGWANAKYISLN